MLAPTFPLEQLQQTGGARAGWRSQRLWLAIGPQRGRLHAGTDALYFRRATRRGVFHGGAAALATAAALQAHTTAQHVGVRIWLAKSGPAATSDRAVDVLCNLKHRCRVYYGLRRTNRSTGRTYCHRAPAGS